MKAITQPGVLALVMARAGEVQLDPPGWSKPGRRGRWRKGHLDLEHYSPAKRARNKRRRQAIRRQRSLPK